jgi:FkbM family methyltransferase
MKKIGDFWLPDIDLRRLSNWGKTRRKTLEYYGQGQGPKTEDLFEALSLFEGGRVAIDGGANVGAYTRILLERFETVYAFEPAPDTFEALSRNIEDWGLKDRVCLHPFALSDRAEKVRLRGKFGHRSLSRRITGEGDIPTMRIDDLELLELDFIKLDVEGYEIRALHGAQETLLKHRPFVLFEDKSHKAELYGEAREAHTFLESLGAELISCVGKNQFDWMYGFPKS